MVSIEKLYASTECGLRIIELHYPEARESSKTKKQFKARKDERTPSASVKLMKSKYGEVWKMTDFGGDGVAKSPIEIHMEATGLRLSEAIADLSMIFNITDELNRSVNRPDIRKEPAGQDQPDGSCTWDIDQNFSETECKIMGPRVTEKHLKALNWYRVNRITSVRNREAVHKYSNEHYPIFMRECWFTDAEGKRDRFYKIYEPLNVDKQWRFQYQPAGKKPRSYVNGLEELKARYKEYNEQEARLWDGDPSNEGKPYIMRKLDEAVICSGERDALCVRSLGYYPLWFNSETYRVSEAEWKEINKYVRCVYNIPDIDETGIRKGTEMALRFLDVRTIWLPEKLRTYRDNRGKPRKDFRDWMEIWKENSDFDGLMELADPAQFWEKTYSIVKNKNSGEEFVKTKWSLDVSCLYCFLKLNGFRTFVDTSSMETKLIKITGNQVDEVTDKNVRDFVFKWCIENGQPRELRNLIITTPWLSLSSLSSLEAVQLDFSTCTQDSQLFFFDNCTIEATANGLVKHDSTSSALNRYVWRQNIVKHSVNILPDMFTITHRDGDFSSEAFDITVNDISSKWFRYLINSSRIYWRQELECNLEEKTREEAEEYRARHKFDIAGPNLTDEERRIQKQCLINKIFAIGYLLHRYKDEGVAWSLYIMDNIIGTSNQCNGRSGKSFMISSLSKLVDILKISGRARNLTDNKFLYSGVKQSQAAVWFDDCNKYLDIGDFYDAITSGITVDKKGLTAYNLSFEDTPKFVFTTNYVPREFDSSTLGRLLPIVTSDYYHIKSPKNTYKENRGIKDDFDGQTLMNAKYPEKDFEADFNCMMQCVKFYLSLRGTDAKIMPNLDNIFIRNHIQNMNETFLDWAESYFAEEGGNLDTEVSRDEMFANYRNSSGDYNMKSKKFKQSIISYVATCSHIQELNPEEKCNTSDGRIVRRITDHTTGKGIAREMFYLLSVKAANKTAEPQPAVPQQKQIFVNQNPKAPERPTECPF